MTDVTIETKEVGVAHELIGVNIEVLLQNLKPHPTTQLERNGA